MIILVKCGNDEELRYDLFDDNKEGQSVYESIIDGLHNSSDKVTFLNDSPYEELAKEDVVGYMTDNGRHFLIRFTLQPDDWRIRLLLNESAFLRVVIAGRIVAFDAYVDQSSLFLHTNSWIREAERDEGYNADYIRFYGDDIWVMFRTFQMFAAVAHKTNFKEDIWA